MSDIKAYIKIIENSDCPRLKLLFDFKTLDVDASCVNNTLCVDCSIIDSLPYHIHCKLVDSVFYKRLWK